MADRCRQTIVTRRIEQERPAAHGGNQRQPRGQAAGAAAGQRAQHEGLVLVKRCVGRFES